MKRGSAEDGEEPPPSFLAACRRDAVADQDRAPLWRLFCRWKTDQRSEAERWAALCDDYAHWCDYLRSRDGDAEAGEEFRRHWRRRVQLFAGGRLAADEVDELAAAFFERVYRLVLPPFGWSAPFGVYLQTLLVNLARDHFRRLGERQRREDPIDDPQSAVDRRLVSAAPSPERALLDAERAQAVQAALETLVPLDRLLLRACLVDDESGLDVAHSLGINPNALYQRLHRAKERLRQALAGAEPRAVPAPPARSGALGARQVRGGRRSTSSVEGESARAPSSRTPRPVGARRAKGGAR